MKLKGKRPPYPISVRPLLKTKSNVMLSMEPSVARWVDDCVKVNDRPHKGGDGDNS